MAWEKTGKDDNRYVRFQAGTAVEGVLKDVFFKPSPFREGELLVDITITTREGDRILSTSSKNLKDQFKDDKIPNGTQVRIEMKVKGQKKLYDVYVNK